jgi:MYXO-CTERM domain-containing protein
MEDIMNMKSIFRLEMYAGMARLALQGFVAACCLGMAMGANAQIVYDPPYFQLFPDQPLAPGATGDDQSVTICGTQTCTADEYMIVEVITDHQTAGTGYRNTFLSLKDPSPQGVTESGYNTDARGSNPNPLQTGVNGYTNEAQHQNQFNHAVLVSDLQRNEGYYEILLDINEEGNDPGKYLKLDQFEIYLSTGGELEEYNPGAADPDFGLGTFAGDPSGQYVRKVFDMDEWLVQASADGLGRGVIGDNCVGTGGCGSGDEDYLFRIPITLFGDAAEQGHFMHLVTSLGEVENSNGQWDPVAITGAGFDEFAALTCTYSGPGNGNRFDPPTDGCDDEGGEVPVPGTAFLLGLGLLGLHRVRRRNPA